MAGQYLFILTTLTVMACQVQNQAQSDIRTTDVDPVSMNIEKVQRLHSEPASSDSGEPNEPDNPDVASRFQTDLLESYSSYSSFTKDATAQISQEILSEFQTDKIVTYATAASSGAGDASTQDCLVEAFPFQTDQNVNRDSGTGFMATWVSAQSVSGFSGDQNPERSDGGSVGSKPDAGFEVKNDVNSASSVARPLDGSGERSSDSNSVVKNEVKLTFVSRFKGSSDSSIPDTYSGTQKPVYRAHTESISSNTDSGSAIRNNLEIAYPNDLQDGSDRSDLGSDSGIKNDLKSALISHSDDGFDGSNPDNDSGFHKPVYAANSEEGSGRSNSYFNSGVKNEVKAVHSAHLEGVSDGKRTDNSSGVQNQADAPRTNASPYGNNLNAVSGVKTGMNLAYTSQLKEGSKEKSLGIDSIAQKPTLAAVSKDGFDGSRFDFTSDMSAAHTSRSEDSSERGNQKSWVRSEMKASSISRSKGSSIRRAADTDTAVKNAIRSASASRSEPATEFAVQNEVKASNLSSPVTDKQSVVKNHVKPVTASQRVVATNSAGPSKMKQILASHLEEAAPGHNNDQNGSTTYSPQFTSSYTWGSIHNHPPLTDSASMAEEETKSRSQNTRSKNKSDLDWYILALVILGGILTVLLVGFTIVARYQRRTMATSVQQPPEAPEPKPNNSPASSESSTSKASNTTSTSSA